MATYCMWGKSSIFSPELLPRILLKLAGEGFDQENGKFVNKACFVVYQVIWFLNAWVTKAFTSNMWFEEDLVPLLCAQGDLGGKMLTERILFLIFSFPNKQPCPSLVQVLTKCLLEGPYISHPPSPQEPFCPSLAPGQGIKHTPQ